MSESWASVDPGVHKVAFAVWDGSTLVNAEYVDLDQARFALAAVAVSKVVVEVPRVYPRSRVRPNDLIDLAFSAGYVVGLTINVVKVFPYQWKGKTPKNLMVQRVKDKLTDEELGKVVLPTKYLQHNVWDAVGIGLHYVKRL